MTKIKLAVLSMAVLGALSATSCSTVESGAESARVPATASDSGSKKDAGDQDCYDSVNCKESSRGKFYKF